MWEEGQVMVYEYRRHEGFRYTFNEPIECYFKLIKIDDREINSDYGNGHIIDISPTGIKLNSSLNLSHSNSLIKIEINFTIAGTSFDLPGIILWQKKGYHQDYYYGVKLLVSTDTTERIVEQIKIHAKNSLTKKGVQKVEVKTKSTT